MRLVTAEIHFTLFPLGMMRSITPNSAARPKPEQARRTGGGTEGDGEGRPGRSPSAHRRHQGYTGVFDDRTASLFSEAEGEWEEVGTRVTARSRLSIVAGGSLAVG